MEPWRLDAEHIEEWIALLVASAHRGWANDFETAGQPIGVERVGKLRGPGVTAPVLAKRSFAYTYLSKNPHHQGHGEQQLSYDRPRGAQDESPTRRVSNNKSEERDVALSFSLSLLSQSSHRLADPPPLKWSRLEVCL